MAFAEERNTIGKTLFGGLMGKKEETKVAAAKKEATAASEALNFDKALANLLKTIQ